MSLDPIGMTHAIRDNYFNYLKSTFYLQDDTLRAEFDSLLRDVGRFTKGPILEATPPFVAGASLEDLIQQELLTKEFRRVNSPRLPMERKLYLHQEQAVRKAVGQSRNLVVTTGTGSGKTETFLIPIFDHLLRQAEQGRLQPGVQALLLYPMNALANDQMARLRELLVNYPGITFGRYTGETKESTREATALYQRMFKRKPLPNELVSREQMRATPPNILLTNYAMLEYLLLRPADNVFFDGPLAARWRFLVIDEAHTYAGAKGIEMAMLLRRLKDRVVGERTSKLQCIATSATLGKGESSLPAAAEFATKLFDEPFAWDANDPTRQDVVRATRQPLRLAEVGDWSPDPELYEQWQRMVANVTGNEPEDALSASTAQSHKKLVDDLAAAGVALHPEAEWLHQCRLIADGDWRRFLYETLRHSEHLQQLQAWLEEQPDYVEKLTQVIFGEAHPHHSALVALVDLAVKARPNANENALLPARYHFFVRAIEGAFLQLRPQRKLFLERYEQNKVGNITYAVFELATCRNCGAAYLAGEPRQDSPHSGQEYLRHPSSHRDEETRQTEYFLLLENQNVAGPDEDELVEELYRDPTSSDAKEEYWLCGQCGLLTHRHSTTSLCSCDPANRVIVQRARSKEGKVTTCASCGVYSPSGLVWRFLTGNDATASVLATAQYQQLPAKTRSITLQNGSDDDEWGQAVPVHSQENPRYHGRQLLVFSDSRQAAAFFAPYLNRTYNQILRRRLILQALEENASEALAQCWRVQDLIPPLLTLARRYGLVDEAMSDSEMRAEMWRWVLYEFMAVDRRNSLEGLGCLGFAVVKPREWKAPTPLLRLGLDEEEVWQLYQVLLANFRTSAAIEFPAKAGVQPTDEFFAPRNRSAIFTAKREKDLGKSRYTIFGWEPAGVNYSNTRIDYLTRLLHKLGKWESRETTLNILRGVWKNLNFDSPQSIWARHISQETIPNLGMGYRLRSDQWELRPSLIDSTIQWYRCDRCDNLTLFHVAGLCPTRGCSGKVVPANLAEEYADLTHGEHFHGNHYFNLYTKISPIPLLAEEHTAQLNSEAASELQTKFVEGEVNLLSCSTTFELGVDVGELESVFMRNVPPSTANYLQRAGRAGRRTDSTAFALTFAQRRSHDLAHFADPIRMVSGEISAPYFEVENIKIVRRHLYATTLAAFWKQYPHTYGKVDTFFFQEGVEDSVEMVREFLAEEPSDLLAALRRIVPPALQPELALEQWGWVAGLVGEARNGHREDGVLTLATARIRSDVADLQSARENLYAAGKPSDHVARVIRTLKQTDIISFLSSQNVIPKYGFPVDVVTLQILQQSEEARRLELDRDLRIALSEYAPSSEVVAGGKLWRSRYLKRLADRDWPSYRYAICPTCNRYQSVLDATEHQLTHCQGCGQPIGSKSKRFLIPKFGFITEEKGPQPPGETPPERTYTTRTFFSGESKPRAKAELLLPGGQVMAESASEGKLAVVNQAGGRGFAVCHSCGFTMLAGEKAPSPHTTPWGRECRGTLKNTHLGHEYLTDILHLSFEGTTQRDPDFWLSLLYGLLEGMSLALEIDRQDLDGCLYPYSGDPRLPALILFDNVPGGAGHVHRLAADP
ncbi:MAG: DEAD/DEAH box helicase, partial [Caldilineaceae bacterium]|nr:DEAD/DEAH box helicase [Caldilineaceae bacterium]